MKRQEKNFLAHEFKALLAEEEFALRGKHNVLNHLTTLAILNAAGLEFEKALTSLKSFKGLPHRCQFVIEAGGVTYINDSKATNVGSTLAAIESYGGVEHANIVLIAGGDGKGADFSPLSELINSKVKQLVLIGKDAKAVADIKHNKEDITFSGDLKEAVAIARSIAASGDVVLLSPACASLDMFKNYEERGDLFERYVLEQVA